MASWVDHDWFNGQCRRCLVTVTTNTGRACVPGSVVLATDDVAQVCAERDMARDDRERMRSQRDDLKRLHDGLAAKGYSVKALEVHDYDLANVMLSMGWAPPDTATAQNWRTRIDAETKTLLDEREAARKEASEWKRRAEAPEGDRDRLEERIKGAEAMSRLASQLPAAAVWDRARTSLGQPISLLPDAKPRPPEPHAHLDEDLLCDDA